MRNSIIWANKHKVDSRKQALDASFQKAFGRWSLSPGRKMISLGGEQVEGGNLIKGTELDHLLSAGMLTPDQYICVEKRQKEYLQNSSLRMKGPTFVHSDLLRFYQSNWHRFSTELLYADLMQTASTKWRGDRTVTDYVIDLLEVPTKGEILYVINLITDSLLIRNKRHGRFGHPSDPWEYIRNHPRFVNLQHKKNLKLVQVFDYESCSDDGICRSLFQTISIKG